MRALLEEREREREKKREKDRERKSSCYCFLSIRSKRDKVSAISQNKKKHAGAEECVQGDT